MAIEQISARAFHEADGVNDWRVVGDGVCAYFRTADFAAGATFTRALSELPGLDQHPPDVDLRPDGVTVRLITVTDDYFGLSNRDLEVARQISVLARESGLTAVPSEIQSVLIVVEALDTADVMPFWQAVLGYARRPDTPDEDLVDRHNRGPAFWFETIGEARPKPGGIHVAVWVPPEEARQRVDAALAAGGRMVRDSFAPAWWTLADAMGNEADIASVKGRD